MSKKNISINTIAVMLCMMFLGGITIGFPIQADTLTGEEQFYRAEAAYLKLIEDSEKVKYRNHWLKCIDLFQKSYKVDPDGPLAPAGLFMCGKLYHELYQRSFKPSDKKEAIDSYQRVVNRFPNSLYKNRALEGLSNFTEKKSDSLKEKTLRTDPLDSDDVTVKKRGELFVKAKADFRKSQGIGTAFVPEPVQTYDAPGYTGDLPLFDNKTVVTGIRFWSNPNYTRVVIDAQKETSYTYKFLQRDPAINKPQRLYIDFENSRLANRFKRIVPINDDLLIDARAGQNTPNSVRVVIDIKSFKSYKIFSYRDPFRTIIDVWGRDVDTAYAGMSSQPSPPSSKKITASLGQTDMSPKDLARQLALGVRRIVIDPGHGGRDAGAVGYSKNILEKDVVLQIARKLAYKIKAYLGCEVIMTRNSDHFLTLEERTAIANTQNADLFISIHTNASEDRRAYGIETYFLNLATDDDAILVAARENATSTKNISDLQAILNNLMKNAKINESSRLAAFVQHSLNGYMKTKYDKINDKGVKQAPFYVLVGANMPSILIETSFITHQRECQRLTDSRYQDHLCEAIVRGIRKYIIETNPTAFKNEKVIYGRN